MRFIPFTILLLTLFAGTAFSQTLLLDDFESNRALTTVFTDGTLTEPVVNPGTNAVNGSPFCAQYVRNSGAPFDVIVYQLSAGGFFNGASVLDILAGNATMTLDVYSAVPGASITISLENAAQAALGFPTGRHSQYTATTTATNAWETVSFSLLSQPDLTQDPAQLDQLVVLFNPGSLTGDTYFYDNVVGPDTTNPCGGVTPDLNIFEDFECQRNATKSFSHGLLVVIDNPDTVGNTSDQVGSYTRADFEEFDVIIYDFPSALDLSTEDQVKLKVWSPDSNTEVRIAFQNASNTDIYAASNITSVVGGWEELTWDLSSVNTSTNIVKAVILFAPGTFLGTTYFYDDFRLEGTFVDPCLGVTPDPNILDDFECQQNITYAFVEGGLATVSNPAPDATNGSSDVATYVRNGDLTDAWGGPLNLGPLDFSTNNQLKMDFLNSNAAATVRVVFQNSSLIDLASMDANSAGTGTWETLTFDFSGISAEVDISNIVMLIAPGDSMLGGNVYYYDNVRLEAVASCSNTAPQNPTSVPNFSDDVTLSWSPVPSATSYELSGGPISLGVSAVQLPVGGTSITVNNLSNGCYVWYVRAICGQAGPGPWSAIDTFCIPAPCVSPTPISSTVTNDDVLLQWTQTPGALGYLIQGGAGTNSTAVSLQVIGGAITSLAVNNLASTTYSWRIQAVCSVTPFNGSGYTAFDIFTIPGTAEKGDGNLNEFLSGQQMTTSVYPNPAANQLMLKIAGLNTDEMVDMMVIDVTGKVLMNQQLNGNMQHPIDVSQLSNGVYFVQVVAGDEKRIERVIIHK